MVLIHSCFIFDIFRETRLLWNAGSRLSVEILISCWYGRNMIFFRDSSQFISDVAGERTCDSEADGTLCLRGYRLEMSLGYDEKRSPSLGEDTIA